MPYKNLRRMKLDAYPLESDTRENFESIEEYINNEVLQKTGWEFAEIEINGTYTAGSPYFFRHNSNTIPVDVMITSVRSLLAQTSAGSVTVLYDEIDDEFIKFTCTSPGARVRFFYGVFKEQKR